MIKQSAFQSLYSSAARPSSRRRPLSLTSARRETPPPTTPPIPHPPPADVPFRLDGVNQRKSPLARRAATEECSGQPLADVPAASALLPRAGWRAGGMCTRDFDRSTETGWVQRQEIGNSVQRMLNRSYKPQLAALVSMNQCSTRALTSTVAPPSPPPETLMSHLFRVAFRLAAQQER